MKKTLEGFRGFSVIAWITVLLFSIFTYKLTTELNQKVERLAPSEAVAELERQDGASN